MFFNETPANGTPARKEIGLGKVGTFVGSLALLLAFCDIDAGPQQTVAGAEGASLASPAPRASLAGGEGAFLASPAVRAGLAGGAAQSSNAVTLCAVGRPTAWVVMYRSNVHARERNLCYGAYGTPQEANRAVRELTARGFYAYVVVTDRY